ncbi:hypothetical protein TWF225_010580 [Orbilia oligospora]|nr:hypothetical protein TWF225_010580 [Orbilia oligospora]KAF3250983.1 hypothetical protein TWF128_007406 [Orbilia oligospora]KAF3259090.1 hypothetical protein TWF217_005236 [Orbilia oligospora]KAF3291941.1 hypothetical protein TWF132_006446 [Orbilia oligospora]
MFNEGPIQALWVLVEAQSVSMNLHPRPFPLSFGANDTSSQMKVMYFRVVERDPPPYLVGEIIDVGRGHCEGDEFLDSVWPQVFAHIVYSIPSHGPKRGFVGVYAPVL